MMFDERNDSNAWEGQSPILPAMRRADIGGSAADSPRQSFHGRRRRRVGWERAGAALLAVTLVGGATVGVTSAYGSLNGQITRQAALIEELNGKLVSQESALAAANGTIDETRTAIDETRTALADAQDALELATKAEALSNVGAADTKASSGAPLTRTTLTKGSSVTDIAEEVGPSVVGIRMTVTTTNTRRFQTGNQQPSEGSGIITSSDGYVITNYHVVSYADPKSGYADRTTLEVFLPDGRSAKASFVGGDSENDLAVLKIGLTGLKAAELGSSSRLEVGELAVAIGNPLGMEFAGSVTVGVVSALNRKIDGEESSLNLIQTDAAINPGNSGGALVNSQGQVIGINTSKISMTGVEGLGFAIAIDDAKPIISSLIAYGYVKNRPYLGITGQDITDVMSQMYNVPVGIYVTEADTEGGAYKAGIRAGDIITGIAGKTVTTMSELNLVKKSYKAGDTVTITYVRNTQKLSVKATFTEAK